MRLGNKRRLFWKNTLHQSGAIDHLVVSAENFNKCPMMGEMLKRVGCELIWWFDDDSYILTSGAFEVWGAARHDAPLQGQPCGASWRCATTRTRLLPPCRTSLFCPHCLLVSWAAAPLLEIGRPRRNGFSGSRNRRRALVLPVGRVLDDGQRALRELDWPESVWSTSARTCFGASCPPARLENRGHSGTRSSHRRLHRGVGGWMNRRRPLTSHPGATHMGRLIRFLTRSLPLLFFGVSSVWAVCHAANPSQGGKEETADREREGCRVNLSQIYDALNEYRARRGDWPAQLAELVPDFLATRGSCCAPWSGIDGNVETGEKGNVDHGYDPATSYSYEFTDTALKDIYWRGVPRITARHFKKQQAVLLAEQGNLVPLVRCLRHGSSDQNLGLDGTFMTVTAIGSIE